MPWGIFAAVMVVALVTATVVLFQHHRGKSGNGAATPALHIASNQGWIYPTTSNFGKWIAFAPNAPLTGYVCGNMSTRVSAPLRFSVTHDGGATWYEIAMTPAQGSTCAISIEPTNADDLVRFGIGYTGVASTFNTYRSHNGGATWSALAAPAGNNFPVYILDSFWAGATLFVAAVADSPTAFIHLAPSSAVSVNGGTLTWVDISHLPPLTNPNDLQELQSGFAIGTTYYAYLYEYPVSCYGPYPRNDTCLNTLLTVVKTSDNGTTWTPSSMSEQLSFVKTLADGHTLMRVSFPCAPSFFTSTDVGQTWTALPTLPFHVPAQGEHAGGGVSSSAPDGTLYAEYYNDSTPDALLKLSPGATSWSTIATTVPDTALIHAFIVSVDSAGHPNAVWSTIFKCGNEQQPCIAYHAP